ncbi:hypothetical protein Tco_0073627 [Tanacetum coccineum]
MAPMASSDPEVKTCSKTCLNNYKTLKKQYDDLLAKQLQTKFESTTYKRGLDTLEAQLVTYRKNEVLFSEEVVVLKREVEFKQYEINTLKAEFEKLKKEKDNIDFKIEKFDKASKDLDQLLESQITDKSKKGFGYSAVPPPHPLIYNRPNKLDLSYSGLEEFQQPEFENGFLIMRMKLSLLLWPRGNQRNWNNQKSQQLESDFVMNNKACFVCGSFDHLKKDCGKRIIKPVWKNTRRVNDHYSTRMTNSNPRRNMIPRAVLMRSGIKVVNTAKPKDAHNVVKRNRFNTVKASACWVRMPKNRVIDHGRNNAQIDEVHFGSDGYTDSGEAGVQQRKKTMMKVRGFLEQKVNHKFRRGLLGIKLNALSTAKSKVSTAHKIQLPVLTTAKDAWFVLLFISMMWMGSEKSKRTTFILINVGSIKDNLKWTHDVMSCVIWVHVVFTWVLDLYYGVHGFDSFAGGLFMAVCVYEEAAIHLNGY